jgi:hypothetical protein
MAAQWTLSANPTLYASFVQDGELVFPASEGAFVTVPAASSPFGEVPRLCFTSRGALCGFFFFFFWRYKKFVFSFHTSKLIYFHRSLFLL